MDFKLAIRITNPNGVDVVFDKLGFDFLVNENQIFSGLAEKQMTIPNNKSAVLEHTITISYLKVASSIIKAIRDREAKYRLRGKAYFNTPVGELSFPVDIVKGKID